MPRTVEALLALIARWHAQGRTVIAVVHDFDQVRAHFPSTLILARTPIAWGDTQVVLTDAQPGAAADRRMIRRSTPLLIAPFEAFSFMRIALVACLALALANGPLGIFLLLRRMALDGNVLSHAVMPGAALGFVYAGHSLPALSLGGLASGGVVAGLTGLLGRVRSAGHDAGLLAFYLVTLALGVTLVALFGSNVDTVRVLFGTVLAIDVRGAAADRGRQHADHAAAGGVLSPAGGRFVRPGVPAPGRRARHARPVHHPGAAQPRGQLPGVRHLAGDRADADAGRGGALLDAPAGADDGAGLGRSACWPRYVGLLLSYHRNLPSGPAIVMAAGAIYGVSLLAAGAASLIRTKLKGNDR